jgi:hypothetical protein
VASHATAIPYNLRYTVGLTPVSRLNTADNFDALGNPLSIATCTT